MRQHKYDDEELSTIQILNMRHMKPMITLELACKLYLPHINNPDTIAKYASGQGFPFPVFKAGDSKKAPYMVKLTALATWIDNQAEQGEQDWKKVNS